MRVIDQLNNARKPLFSFELLPPLKGIYLDDELKNSTATDFCVGIAGYPEKHIESPNIAYDLIYLKEKIDAGAQYIITQMFFENHHYLNFVSRCREAGITVPIIPGLKPIATLQDITILPQVFNIDIREYPSDRQRRILIQYHPHEAIPPATDRPKQETICRID